MNEPYVPTTQGVLDTYIWCGMGSTSDEWDADRTAEFNRWLNEVQAQAWDESAEKACGDNWLPDTNGNPGRPNLSDMKRLNPLPKGKLT